jgi:methyl-accepting chemotaxis protein
MSLTISRRLALLVAIAILGSVAIIGVQLAAMRAALVQERQTAIAAQVQAAASIVKEFAAAMERGLLSEVEAQQRAKSVLRGIRFGKNDYIFVYQQDGTNIVLGPRPELEGKNLMESKDSGGIFYVREIIASGARGAGSFVSYMYPRAGSDKPAAKMAHAVNVGPWNWVIGTGVYIDDLDEAFHAAVRTALLWAAGAIGLLCTLAFLLARGLVLPMRAMTLAMTELAAGKLEMQVPGSGRGDEIGKMAAAVEVFKANALVRQQLEDEQKAAESRAAAQRKADMHSMAADFENAVGEIVDTVSSASTELEASAGSLTATAERSQELTAMVAVASGEASTNVQSVAAATEEMSSSINEIGRQVQSSAQVAREAVEQAQRTNGRVGELSKAASRIGDVLELINTIASQTNLLALNATIEAARAGDAGRGFAVVASEVKALAEQTANATSEISQHISGIQSATTESVHAIKEIADTIGRMSEISSSIAAAVEEQGVATQEISRNVQQAAHGTQRVSANITDVQRGTSETEAASSQVLSAAQSLSVESNRLKLEVGKFLNSVRAA